MRRVLFLISVIFITGNLSAQKDLSFEFDYARFNYDSLNAHIEIYYSISQSDLTIFEQDGNSIVSAKLQITATDKKSKELVVNKIYNINSPIQKVDDKTVDKNLIGAISYLLPQGDYYFELKASDLMDSTTLKYLNEEIVIDPISKSDIKISDIELSSRIITESKNSNSIFYKNTMEVTPNPQNVFGKGMPMLFYYSEFYNLTADSAKGELFLNRQIQNSYGVKVLEKSKKMPKNVNSIVEADAVNISKLPTGSYTLFLNLINTSSQRGVSSSKRFYILNPDVKDTLAKSHEQMSFVSSEFGVMSDEECEELFAAAKHISTSKEIEQYQSLDSLNAKREFLFKLFKSRDNIPETPYNEFKRDFDARIRYIDDRYRTFNKRGIKTDRGRIYLTYGEPDEIDMHPNEYEQKPYEIWYYHSIEGGVMFVFGDITGYSDYELLHSTKRGELRDDNWMRRITAN